MIGLYLHRDGLRFCAKLGGSFSIYDHPLDDREPWDSEWIEGAFEMAKVELSFSSKDDFRLLVDRPHAYAVAQSVPFGEKQLAQVLENYLEEECPEDIEDLQFDHLLLHSKGQHSTVLGFWIRKNILSAWCRYADEQALNSLDIQPAESMLLPDPKAEPSLKLSRDLQGNTRYCSLHMVDGLPHLTLGSLKSKSLEKAAQHLKLQGSHWSQLKQLLLDKELSEWQGLESALGIPHCEFFDSPIPSDPFSAAALEGAPILFQFRKGHFAQKGIGERLLAPLLIATCACCAWLGVWTWSNHHEAELTAKKVKNLRRSKAELWTMLFPEKRVPSSRMSQQLEGYLKSLNNGSNNSEDDGNISSLQALGLLFSAIEADDDVLIERASIGKSINLTGSSRNQDRIYKLSEGFQDNKDFREPNITSTKRNKEGQAPIYQFRFSTAYTGDEP